MGVAKERELGLVVYPGGWQAGQIVLKDSTSQSALPLAMQEREQPPAYPDGEVW